MQVICIAWVPGSLCGLILSFKFEKQCHTKTTTEAEKMCQVDCHFSPSVRSGKDVTMVMAGNIWL